MNKMRKAIEDYQCAGCVSGSDTRCGKFAQDAGAGQCINHVVGTSIPSLGRIYLGLPKGFNRQGFNERAELHIYARWADWVGYDFLKVPVWKYRNERGHTFVRMFMPRINQTWIQVFLEDCMDRIDCLEITAEHLDQID